MKALLLVSVLFFTTAIFAQNKITIMCEVNYSRNPVDYNILDKVLPDSLKQSNITDPYKAYGMKNTYAKCLWLLNNGWKLVSGPSTSQLIYLFTKEINMDDEAFAQYKEKILEVGKHN